VADLAELLLDDACICLPVFKGQPRYRCTFASISINQLKMPKFHISC